MRLISDHNKLILPELCRYLDESTNPHTHTHTHKVDPLYVLIIVFTGRVWDAFTDPFIGFLCTQTKTRWGRLRPWSVPESRGAKAVWWPGLGGGDSQD